jgi:hypothetical protein
MKMFALVVMTTLALTGINVANNGALAGESQSMVVAVSNAGSFCARVNEAGLGTCGLTDRAHQRVRGGLGPLAAVTCGSGQWCCRHDIGGSGACVQCCNR